MPSSLAFEYTYPCQQTLTQLHSIHRFQSTHCPFRLIHCLWAVFILIGNVSTQDNFRRRLDWSIWSEQRDELWRFWRNGINRITVPLDVQVCGGLQFQKGNKIIKTQKQEHTYNHPTGLSLSAFFPTQSGSLRCHPAVCGQPRACMKKTNVKKTRTYKTFLLFKV